MADNNIDMFIAEFDDDDAESLEGFSGGDGMVIHQEEPVSECHVTRVKCSSDD